MEISPHPTHSHYSLNSTENPFQSNSYDPFASPQIQAETVFFQSHKNRAGDLAFHTLYSLSRSSSASSSIISPNHSLVSTPSTYVDSSHEQIEHLSKSKQIALKLADAIARVQFFKNATIYDTLLEPHIRPLSKSEINQAKRNQQSAQDHGSKVSRRVFKRLDELSSNRQQKISELKSDFFSFVISHNKSLSNKWKQQQKIRKGLNKAVLNYFDAKIRATKTLEQLKAEAEFKRIQALQTNDEAEYRRLLKQAKSERLDHIIRSTDKYLVDLLNLVRGYQQQKAVERKQDTFKISSKSSAATFEEGELVRDLGNCLHQHVEQVVQPSILVGGTLKKYQLEGLRWLISLYNNNLSGILADDMGLGKTIQTLALLSYLVEFKGNPGPYLIVVPVSTISNWMNESAKWVPSLVTVQYIGRANIRKDLRSTYLSKPGSFNILLTSYEMILNDRRFLSDIHWKYVIIDEGHRLKNSQNQLAKSFRKHFKSDYRLLLTGTPLQNDASELWSLLNFLLPEIFNSSQNFSQWFSQPFADPSKRQKVDSNMTQEEELLVIRRLHKVLEPFLLRRRKAAVADQLPEKFEHIIYCGMSSLQKKMYTSLTKFGAMADMTNTSQRSTVFKSLNNIVAQLRKICSHPFLFEAANLGYSDEILIRSSGKFFVLDNILAKMKLGGHRVLLFSTMKQVLHLIELLLQFRGYKYLRLDGDTPQETRAHFLDLFNSPDSPYFIFILTTRAGGLGLNLQTADTVVLFDSDWNPQMDLQAQDRAHRIGQKSVVKIFRLVTANSIDQKIVLTATSKRKLDDKIIQAGIFNTSATAAQRRSKVSELLQNDDESSNILTGDTELATFTDLNMFLHRTQDELNLFEAYDSNLPVSEPKLAPSHLTTLPNHIFEYSTVNSNAGSDDDSSEDSSSLSELPSSRFENRESSPYGSPIEPSVQTSLVNNSNSILKKALLIASEKKNSSSSSLASINPTNPTEDTIGDTYIDHFLLRDKELPDWVSLDASALDPNLVKLAQLEAKDLDPITGIAIHNPNKKRKSKFDSYKALAAQAALSGKGTRRPRRNTKNVVYKETLSDEQYINLIHSAQDNGLDPNKILNSIHKAKKRRLLRDRSGNSSEFVVENEIFLKKVKLAKINLAILSLLSQSLHLKSTFIHDKGRRIPEFLIFPPPDAVGFISFSTLVDKCNSLSYQSWEDFENDFKGFIDSFSHYYSERGVQSADALNLFKKYQHLKFQKYKFNKPPSLDNLLDDDDPNYNESQLDIRIMEEFGLKYNMQFPSASDYESDVPTSYSNLYSTSLNPIQDEDDEDDEVQDDDDEFTESYLSNDP